MARGVIALLLLASCATAQPRAAKPVAKKPAARKVKPEPIVLAAPAPRIGSCGDAPRSEEKPSKSGWIWPVDGVVISKYGEGIEIAAPHGTPIWAARSGTVLVSSEREGYGKLIIVRHDGDRLSIYAHNAKNCVSEGDAVHVGDVVGLVGDSGGSASPKVHFEVRNGEKAVNPRSLLP